jgi:RNA polymerase sigma-70 factor (ECF subfamily)
MKFSSQKLMGKVDPSLEVENANSGFHDLLTEKEFEIFFKENFIPLCAFCRFKYKFDLDVAKEMAHTAFIKLWETHDPNLSSFSKGFLYKILTNNCMDYIRHERVKAGYEDYSKKTFPADGLWEESSKLDLQLLTEKIQKSISELPEQMRHIFLLSRNEGLKYNQIAKFLGISVKTVETQMSRALLKLRSKLAEFRSLLLFLDFVYFYF